VSRFRQIATASAELDFGCRSFPGSCAKLVGPGRLRLTPGCGLLMSAPRLARGGPGALASPAFGRRHDPAESVVVGQQVELGAEAALRIPGEPLVRERLELKRGDPPAAAPGRALAAETALAQVADLRSPSGCLVSAGWPGFRCLAGVSAGQAPGLLPLGPPRLRGRGWGSGALRPGELARNRALKGGRLAPVAQRAGADVERGRDLELLHALGKQLRRPPLLGGPGASAPALVGALLHRSGPAAPPRPWSGAGLGSGGGAGDPGRRLTKVRASECAANLRRRHPVPVPVRPAGGEAPTELLRDRASRLPRRVGRGQGELQPDRRADLQLVQPLARLAGDAELCQPEPARDQVDGVVGWLLNFRLTTAIIVSVGADARKSVPYAGTDRRRSAALRPFLACSSVFLPKSALVPQRCTQQRPFRSGRFESVLLTVSECRFIVLFAGL
jgi:hypothetical protein